MTENRKIHAGEDFPDLELRADIQRGWIVPTLCRSEVEPPTGKLHPREGIGWMTENRKIHAGEDFPDLELRADIQRGWIVPTLCRSGVEPPTGTIHPREGIGWMTENRKIHAGEDFPDLELRADIQRGWIVPTLCRSGVEPPTGTIHPRKGIGWMTENRKIHAGEDFPDLELRADIQRGWIVPTLCRSGVEPPTGSSFVRRSGPAPQ